MTGAVPLWAEHSLVEAKPARLPDWIRQTAAVAALALAAVYLVWRAVSTLNTAALWLAIPVWGAEVYGALAAALFFFTAWQPLHRVAPPAPEGSTVDVLIPTRDEPVWMVRRAILGAQAIRYPHATYVLDEGNRVEVARLSEELGCAYVPTPLARGKAATLNQALRESEAEFVAVFDADHVPVPEFLDRTLGYFQDERVVFVQTALDFYNVDSYEHRYDVASRRTWHDQALFFRVTQPGKDRWNAALFFGSCAVFRRRPLEEVGGFAPETVAGDLHTSIRLHARGGRSVYHDEVLAYGLAPATAGSYHAERLRGGRGAMQVLRYANPLTFPGLTIAQRLAYLGTMGQYFNGLQKLVFYLTPSVYLLGGILPVRVLDPTFAVSVAVTYGFLLLAYKLVCRGYGMALLNEHYNMVRFYTYIKSTAALFGGRRGDEDLHPAVAGDRRPWRVLIPVLAVFGLNDISLYTGTLRFVTDVDPNPLAYAGGILWATWNIWLGVWAVWFAMRKVERRSLYRVPVAVPVRYASEEGDNGIGVLVDVHEEGAGLLVPQAPFEAHRAWVQFLWFDDSVGMDGDVVHQRETSNGLHLGLRLRGLPAETRDFLATFVILFAQRKFMQEVDGPMDALGASASRRDRRRTPRWRWHLPVRVDLEGQEVWGVTQNVSDHGALVLFPRPLPPGLTFRLAAWMSPVAHEATVAHTETIDLPPYRLYRAGLNIRPAPLAGARRSTHRSRRRELAASFRLRP